MQCVSEAEGCRGGGDLLFCALSRMKLDRMRDLSRQNVWPLPRYSRS